MWHSALEVGLLKAKCQIECPRLGGVFFPFRFDEIRDSFLFEASTDVSCDPLNDRGGRHFTFTLLVCVSEEGPQTVQFIVFMFCHDEVGCVAWTWRLV
jgi:hypothetical protein